MYYSQDDGQTWEPIYIKALDSMPLGATILWPSNQNVPTGWMICDGTNLDKTVYPELFNVIGNLYGGTGANGFKLPDLRGRVPVGVKYGDSDFQTIATTGGSKFLQAHRHKTGIQASYYGAGPSGSDTCQVLVDTSNGIETSETGTGNSGNLQPYIVMNYIIKVTNTTPTMASVVNATNNSTTDTYSCDYSNKHYGGVVLYSGNTSSNVTLSDSASNYSYIEVFGQKSGCYGYVKIYSPNGKQFGLAIHNTYESNNIQQIFGRYTISGTTITKDFEVYMNNNGSPTNSNVISIEKVIGYK